MISNYWINRESDMIPKGFPYLLNTSINRVLHSDTYYTSMSYLYIISFNLTYLLSHQLILYWLRLSRYVGSNDPSITFTSFVFGFYYVQRFLYNRIEFFNCENSVTCRFVFYKKTVVFRGFINTVLLSIIHYNTVFLEVLLLFEILK